MCTPTAWGRTATASTRKSCDYVLVDSCTFDTGDDCIAIKSGKDLDTQYGPSQNIVIQNCTMQSGHGAVTLGSEMAGGIQNVFAQDLVFQNINWATNPLNTAIRLKTNMNRGGYLRNFYVRNVSIPNGVQTSPSFYASLPGSPIASRTVAVAAGARRHLRLRLLAARRQRAHPAAGGIERAHLERHGRQCHQGRQAGIVLPGDRDPRPGGVRLQRPAAGAGDPAGAATSPSATAISARPANAAQPWYLYNVKGLTLKNVTIGGRVHNTTLSA